MYKLYKRGETWHVYFVDREGHRVRSSTKQTEKRKAVVIADALYARHGDASARLSEIRTLADACRGFLDMKRESNVSQATLDIYGQKLRNILGLLGAPPSNPGLRGYYGDIPLSRLTSEMVDRYSRARMAEVGKHRSGRHTAYKERVALRQVLKFAKHKGWLDKDVTQILAPGYASRYKPRETWLTIPQMVALLYELPLDVGRYVAWTCATTGRDLAATRATGGDWTSTGILVRDEKTASSYRVQAVNNLTFPFAWFAFWGVAAGAPVAAALGGRRKALERACKRLGLPKVSSNDLRRSVAHWFKERMVPAELCARFFGHRSTKMIMEVYGRQSDEELAIAMTRLLGGSVIKGMKPLSDVVEVPEKPAVTLGLQAKRDGWVQRKAKAEAKTMSRDEGGGQ